MSSWLNKTVLEINRAVAVADGHHLNADCCNEQDAGCYKGCECENAALTGEPPNGKNFDYCNNIQAAWPIILDNKIELTLEGGFTNKWCSQQIIHLDDFDVDIIGPVYHENPLVAAMIIFLEKKGVKP